MVKSQWSHEFPYPALLPVDKKAIPKTIKNSPGAHEKGEAGPNLGREKTHRSILRKMSERVRSGSYTPYKQGRPSQNEQSAIPEAQRKQAKGK